MKCNTGLKWVNNEHFSYDTQTFFISGNQIYEPQICEMGVITFYSDSARAVSPVGPTISRLLETVKFS